MHSAICAKIWLLGLQKMNVALAVRVGHGNGSLAPVAEIVMNVFAGLKVQEAVTVVSVVNTEDGLDLKRGGDQCPYTLTTIYWTTRLIYRHLYRQPLGVPKGVPLGHDSSGREPQYVVCSSNTRNAGYKVDPRLGPMPRLVCCPG